MYSILRSEKRVICHEKRVSVTASIFLTNSHLLFCFSNSTIVIYFISFLKGQLQNQKKIWQEKVSSMALTCKRLHSGACIVVCKNLSNIYLLELVKKQQKEQDYYQGRLRPLEKSQFAQVIQAQNFNDFINVLGCQIKLETLLDGSFLVLYYIYQDSKLILDCYRRKKEEKTFREWALKSVQTLVEGPGNYIFQFISKSKGYICVYRQQYRQQENWKLRFLNPFADRQEKGDKNQTEATVKQFSILLPQDQFCSNTVIIQVCQYFNSYMIVTISKINNQIKLYTLHLREDQIEDNLHHFVIQPLHIFTQTICNIKSLKILEINLEAKVLYASSSKHQFVQGQIYENCLMAICGQTGKILQSGFCTLRDINFSPNYESLLDLGVELDKLEERKSFFHIRKLLEKKSLYMLLIESEEKLKSMSETMKRLIIQYL